MGKPPRLFVDMDGVLTNFDKAACAAHNTTVEAMEALRPPGQWTLVGVLAPTMAEFWGPINKLGEAFWVKIEPLPWLEEVLEVVKEITPDWHIVSSPSMDIDGYTGKVKWLKNYFGRKFDRFMLTPHKYALSARGSILIDDSQDNCYNFVNDGLEDNRLQRGKAVLFPSTSNSFNQYANNPVPKMKILLGQVMTVRDLYLQIGEIKNAPEVR